MKSHRNFSVCSRWEESWLGRACLALTLGALRRPPPLSLPYRPARFPARSLENPPNLSFNIIHFPLSLRLGRTGPTRTSPRRISRGVVNEPFSPRTDDLPSGWSLDSRQRYSTSRIALNRSRSCRSRSCRSRLSAIWQVLRRLNSRDL